MLSLNSDMLVLSVDLHPTQALVAVFDLHNRQLTQEQVPVHSGALDRRHLGHYQERARKTSWQTI